MSASDKIKSSDIKAAIPEKPGTPISLCLNHPPKDGFCLG